MSCSLTIVEIARWYLRAHTKLDKYYVDIESAAPNLDKSRLGRLGSPAATPFPGCGKMSDFQPSKVGLARLKGSHFSSLEMQASFSSLVPTYVENPCDYLLKIPSAPECTVGSQLTGAWPLTQPFVGWFVFLCKLHDPKVVSAASRATEKLISQKLLKYLQTELNRNLECSGNEATCLAQPVSL